VPLLLLLLLLLLLGMRAPEPSTASASTAAADRSLVPLLVRYVGSVLLSPVLQSSQSPRGPVGQAGTSTGAVPLLLLLTGSFKSPMLLLLLLLLLLGWRCGGSRQLYCSWPA
jgi:hypothetical protein